jgi:TrkA domain protein
MALGQAAGASQLEALARLGVHHAFEIVEVEPEARAVGSHPVTLNLRHETGATVVAVVRDGQVISTPDSAFRFGVGDIVLLAGEDEALARGRAVFMRPLPPGPPGSM